MKRTGIIFILGLLLASLGWAQNGDNPAFDSVTFPVFSLNPVPVPGASIALVGQPGQATWYFWASANYQLGSVVSYLGSVSNAPNTLSGSSYISIIPTAYPAGVLTVDILATTGPLAPVGACNCAIATGLTSGAANFQSNTLSSYTVSILNPQAFNLRLTNEVTGTGVVSLVLRNAYTGALVCNLSTACGAGGGNVPLGTPAQVPVMNQAATAYAPQNKPQFNVLDNGATGNGSTDDRVAINAALTACANTGGTVILPPTSASYYVANSIQAVSNCTLDGQGGAKITIPSAGWTLVAHTGFGIVNVYNVSQFSVHGLEIVGTESVSSGNTPKLIYVDNVNGLDISHNYLHGSSYEGIWIGGTITSTSDMRVSENRFYDIAYTAELQALYIGGNRATATGNTFDHVGVGIGMSGCSVCAVTGNSVHDPSNVGIASGDGGTEGPSTVSGNTVSIVNLNGASSQRGFYDEGSGGPSYPNYATTFSGNTCYIAGVTGYRPAVCYFGQVPDYPGTNGTEKFVSNYAQINCAGVGFSYSIPSSPLSATVISDSNTAELINDCGVAGNATGFTAIPNGSGNTINIYSSNDKALGFTRANSEYAIDFNHSAGGTLNAYVWGDSANSTLGTPDGGYVRIGNVYNATGAIDNDPIFTNYTGGTGSLGNNLAASLPPALWSNLGSPAANLALSMGTYTTTMTFADPEGSHTSWLQTLPALSGSPTADQFKITDTNGNTNLGTLFRVETIGTSTAHPFRALANGNGVDMDSTGLLQKVGTGSIRADSIANLATFVGIVQGNPNFTGSVIIGNPFACGSLGTASCVITGYGVMSGNATITFPDSAGGPIVFSNNLSAPAFVSTIAMGTAPLSVVSTTNVPNLNASSLNGATFANPGPIGTTPSTGGFTTLTVSTSVKIVNATYTSTAGVPSASCGVGDLDTNTSASSASTVLYVCYPANTWNAVTVP